MSDCGRTNWLVCDLLVCDLLEGHLIGAKGTSCWICGSFGKTSDHRYVNNKITSFLCEMNGFLGAL